MKKEIVTVRFFQFFLSFVCFCKGESTMEYDAWFKFLSTLVFPFFVI